MAKQKNPAAMEHIVNSLKSNKNAVYADIKAAADKKGLKIFPVMFGRAKLLLGLVKAAPRGTGRWAKAKAAKAAKSTGMPLPTKRGPGRPRKNPLPASNGVADLSSIIQAVRNTQVDAGRYRAMLERIGSMVSEALG